MKNRTEIIQYFINKINAKKYLEIGMGPGENHNLIVCEYKVSVDPHSYIPVTYKMTSDDFFKENKETFDVIFIDGLHHDYQVYNDIINSLDILSEGGYIICHDMNPTSELMQRVPQPISGQEWTGDCWKAWVRIRSEREDLKMHVIDLDYGCGIISKGPQEKIIINSDLTWDLLKENRTELLNLISVDKFIENY
jgi:predicted O-methyltransferase YrrM